MNDFAKLLTVTQTQEENPRVFSERLKEALIKYTAILPSSPMADIILKDKFVTQSAPDIQKKLQNLTLGPQGTLEELLGAAKLVFTIGTKRREGNRRRS